MAASNRKDYEADIKWWEITDREHFINRREFMRQAGTVAAGIGLVTVAPGFVGRAFAQNGAFPGLPGSKYDTDEDPNTLKQAIEQNNFYEIGVSSKRRPRKIQGFTTSPWQISIAGHVTKPGTIDVADLISRYRDKLEQRIYRLRCVETWAMVIPWVGFPLHELIKDYEPTSRAKYVRFETHYDREEMPRALGGIDYPYIEGLRMDEAMNDLTLLTVGMYGDILHTPNGPPIRLIVPWKYGFKSIKSVVKIEFVEDEPVSTWTAFAAHRYGFYSNVNPDTRHAGWSQRFERKIGVGGRRLTEMFNGYGEWVAPMYEGMDLSEVPTIKVNGRDRHVRGKGQAPVPHSDRQASQGGCTSADHGAVGGSLGALRDQSVRGRRDRGLYPRHRQLGYQIPADHARRHAAARVDRLELAHYLPPTARSGGVLLPVRSLSWCTSYLDFSA